MRHEDLFYVLALLKVEGIGDVLAKKLLSHFDTAKDIFDAPVKKLEVVEGIGSFTIRNIRSKSAFSVAEAELQYISKNNIRTVFFKDDDYPDRLKHCPDGPVLLFMSGNIDLKNRKIISIVGTRQVTPHGSDFCRELISSLAPLNPVIVSGFAYGVDIVAHQAALENNLQTVGVIAHGLNQIYPKNHKKFVSRIEENGGFITEFWSSSDPEKENFIKRNRIVAGLSEATIVIESAERGGSLITANFAIDYNREIFAVPGRVTDKYSQGCNNLIKTQKAHLLTSAADLVYILGWELQTKSKSVQKQLFISLDSDEQKVHDYLLENGKQLMDIIAIECGIPVFRASSLLLNMELKGAVRPLPGKMFEAV